MVREPSWRFCIMKTFYLFLLISGLAISAFAQSDLDKMVETERSFARMASERGTKAAFLQYMAPDAVVFDPEKTNAKAVWTEREESAALLSWAPNYADISSNGVLGYTTGNWEYRPKGKSDNPTAFGDFFTIWLRQPSGQYRWVLDFGVGHAQPDKYSTELTQPTTPTSTSKSTSAAEYANGFFSTAASQGLKKAYERYAANDVRFLRLSEYPGMGRKALVAEAVKTKAPLAFAKRSVFFESADLAYVTNTYQTTNDKGVAERGNSVQIWKFRDGRWQIVFDILRPIPPKIKN
jgi:ketosteroid isomerase-like protein